MKRISLRFLILTATISIAHAQRYKNQIFDEVSEKTFTYLTTETDTLQIDVYQAKEDTQKLRPMILFVHGGGFAGGARNEPEIKEFCRNMARRGIVAASMSYTLTMKGQSFGCKQAAENKMATFKQSGLEISAATKYLLERKGEFNIHPNQVILVGSSAGAEAVLHAAFWPETQTPLPDNFKYAGLISMAGALFDLSLITKETAMPIQLFHGTCDDLVPYGSAPHHYCDEQDAGYLMLHGAGSIVERMKELNKSYYLMTGCGDNHSWAGKPFKHYREQIADFIYQDVIQGKFRQLHQILMINEKCAIVEAPNVCLD